MKITRLLLALLLAVPLYGQTISGNITTSSTDCSIGAACISLPLPTSAAAATIQVVGTYTGTLQFELTSDAKGCLAAAASFVNVSASPLPSGTAASSTTSTGTWRTNAAGGTCLRVRASALASGTAAVTLNYGTGSASTGAGGGSATTFDTLASGTNTSAAMVVGTGASLAASGSGTIAATSVPFSGVAAGTNTGALVIGTGGSLGVSGTGTIAATSIAGFTGTLNQIPKGTGGALTDSIALSESFPTFTVNESQATNGTHAVVGDVTTTQLTAPSTLVCIQGAATGGFLLHNQAYFYKVTAISANGQTTVSNESTFTTAASPTGDTYTASCTWTGHTGDTGYKLYRGTVTNTELLLATITPGNVNSYTDNTNTTPSGAMPSANTTGSITAAGTVTMPNFSSVAGTMAGGATTGGFLTFVGNSATRGQCGWDNGQLLSVGTGTAITCRSAAEFNIATNGNTLAVQFDTSQNLLLTGKLTSYGGLATVGNGLGSVQSAPTAVTIGSGANIAATSLCSTTLCPAGDYDVAVYIEITTACTTTGTYIPWLGWTDDQGAKAGSSTTTYFAGGGLGVTPATASTGATLGLASLSNFLTGHIYLHTTGAATSAAGSINYGATATACGTGGPMVGKMYLTVTRLR